MRLGFAGLAAAGSLALVRGVFGGPGPYEVTARESEVSDGGAAVVLKGDVEVLQAGRRLRAPRIDLSFGPPSGGRQRAIRRMQAQGPAWFVAPDQAARADHVEYDAVRGELVLTGHVTLTQGRDVATGDRLVIDEARGVSTLSASPGGRVRSVIHVGGPEAAAGRGDR